MRQYNNLRALIAVLICISFIFCTLNVKSFDFEQETNFSWLINCEDLDYYFRYPFQRSTYHELVAVEVHDSYLYVARGTNRPNQLLKINQQTGDLVWCYINYGEFNKSKPFIISDNVIICNYLHEIKFLSKSDGKVLDEIINKDAPFSVYSLLAYNDNKVIIKESDSKISLYDYNEKIYLWKIDLSQYDEFKLIGYYNNNIYLLLREKSSLSIASINASNSSINKIVQIPLAILVEASVQEDTIFVLYIDRENNLILSKFSIKENKSYEINIRKLDDLLSITNGNSKILNPNNDYLSIKMFIKNSCIYTLFGSSNRRSGTCLIISSINANDLKVIWTKDISSTIYQSLNFNQSNINENFLIMNTVIFIDSKYISSFWIYLSDGTISQSIFDYLEYSFSMPTYGFVTFDRTLFITAAPDSSYLIYIAGLYYNLKELNITKKINPQIKKTEIKPIWKKPIFPEEYVRTYDVFSINNNVYLLSEWINEKESEQLHLYNIDPENGEISSDIKLEDANQGLFSGYYLNNLVCLFASDYYGGNPQLSCYDIKTGKLMWSKKSYILYQIRDKLLLADEDEGGIIGLASFDNGKYIWKAKKFEDFIGVCESNNIALFLRNSCVISILDINNGEIVDELYLPTLYGFSAKLYEDKLIIDKGGGDFQCYSIKQRKIIWSKNLGIYSNIFISDNFLYGPSWKNSLIIDDVLYDVSGSKINALDLNTGNRIKEISLNQYTLNQILYRENEKFFISASFDIGDNKNSTNILFLSLSNINTIFAYELKNIPASEYKYSSNLTIISCNGSKYVIVNSPTLIFYKLSEDINVNLNSINPINMKTEFSNYLYLDNKLIFQAAIGKNNSNFYLMAFDTKNGEIIRIHKGMHERIFIKNNLLYFQQYGLFYAAPLGYLTNVQLVDYSDPVPLLVSQGASFEPMDEKEKVPEKYKNLNLYYINCVAEGNFSKEDEKETIFITGDESGIKVGIIGKENGIYVPVITGETKTKEVVFWQVEFFDVDGDNLDEIILIAFNPVDNYFTFMVGDFYKDSNRIEFNFKYMTKYVEDSEIVLFEDQIYLRIYIYKYISDNYSFEQRKYKLNYDKTSGKYSLDFTNLDFPHSLYKHEIGEGFKEFQFLNNPTNDLDYTKKVNKSIKYPKLILPDNLVDLSDRFNKDEISYIEKKNSINEQFIKLIDSGNNPFKDVKLNLFNEEYSLTLEEVNEDKNNGNIQIIEVILLFSIVHDDKQYIICKICDKWNDYTVILFDADFKYIDHYSYRDEEYVQELVVSLNYPDRFWIGVIYGRGFHYTYGFFIKDNRLCAYTFGGYPSLIYKDTEPFFEVYDHYGYVDGLGNVSRIYGSHYVDPWSGDRVDYLFKEKIEDQLDRLYGHYFYYRSLYIIPGYHIFSEDDFWMKNKLKKRFGISDSVYIIEDFEYINYGYF